jgi:hypothetical protein
VQRELERKLLLWSLSKDDRLPENRTVKHHYAEVKRRAEQENEQ